MSALTKVTGQVLYMALNILKPGFLKFFLSTNVSMLTCVCVCSQGINNHRHDMV